MLYLDPKFQWWIYPILLRTSLCLPVTKTLQVLLVLSKTSKEKWSSSRNLLLILFSVELNHKPKSLINSFKWRENNESITWLENSGNGSEFWKIFTADFLPGSNRSIQMHLLLAHCDFCGAEIEQGPSCPLSFVMWLAVISHSLI